MRKVFISLILLLIFSRLPSQQKPALRSFNIELGKNGMVTNLYYDQVIKNKNYGFRLGAGSNFARYLREVTGTVGGYYLVGKRSNFLKQVSISPICPLRKTVMTRLQIIF